jgi:hypothetical protein
MAEWTDPALDMANLRYHVERDVAVVIGATRAKSGRLVALDAFLNWLRLTTIDIRGLTYPFGVISTAHGDLVLDPRLRGRLYHNGITLTNSTAGGAFLFAYNFAIRPPAAIVADRHPGRMPLAKSNRYGRELYASRKTLSYLYLLIFCGSMSVPPTPR